MKTIRVSDEVFEQLKRFVVDPFNDTPEVVIRRLVDIANTAKNRWSRWDAPQQAVEPQRESRPMPAEARPQAQWAKQCELIM